MSSRPAQKSDFLIMIVDDEKDFLTSMEYWFKTQGYSVVALSGGEEALEYLRTRVPDLVFLDYRMPGLDGLETLARIRRISPSLPVVLLTAHGQEHVRLEAFRLKANGVFDKTLDFYKAEHFLNSLVRVMSRQRPKLWERDGKKWVVAAMLMGCFLLVFVLRAALSLEPRVCFGNSCVKVELADTPEERAQGLMARSSLPADRGMLFLFPREGFWSFWMKDTYIPLDVIWIGKDGKIAEIIQNARPMPGVLEPPSFGGIHPSFYVLEVNAGFAARHGLKTGQKAIFKWIYFEKGL